MRKLKSNFIIADFVSQLNIGILRNYVLLRL